MLFEIYLSIGSAVLGVIISLVIQKLLESKKFKRELSSNNNIDISGEDWIAAWQASVDGENILNTEEIILQQKGGTIKINNKTKSPENLKGGYLWSGQLQFYYGRDLMGWYFPIKSENNTSKGIMFFNYNSAQKIFIGKWIGSAYDSPLSAGFVVISKNKKVSLQKLNTLIAKHPADVSIIEQSI